MPRIKKSLCRICNKEYSDILEHISECSKTLENKKGTDNFLLEIISADCSKYWLYILVPANFELKKLDNFLRGIWLECCDHLSKFEIDGMEYFSNGKKMKYCMDQILDIDSEFLYEYDMGDTTRINITVIDSIIAKNNKINILSRNTEPYYKCCDCGKYNSTKICYLCCKTFCEKYFNSESHECDIYDELSDSSNDENNMLVGMVNSPRRSGCFLGNFEPAYS